MTEKMTLPKELAPVPVTIIGTRNVVGGPDPLSTGMSVTTPAPTQPNLLIHVVTPMAAIAIRFTHTYLTMLVGLMSAGMATDIIPARDFMELTWACAQLSVAGAGLGLLKDCVTVFSRLESKYPLMTGSV